MLWRFREQIWWKWNSAITNHWWSVDLLRAATHNVVWPLAAWSAAPSPLAPWSPPLATRGPGSCPLLLPTPPPPLARSETSNWSTTDNREQLSDNDDDCAESWLRLMYLDGKESRLKIYYNYVPIIYFAFNGDWDERNYVRRLESFWTINPCWDEIWVTRSVTTF